MTNSEEMCDCECQSLLKHTYKRCTPENPYISIRKAVMLMDNPVTSDDYDRHLYVINDFLRACTYAYWLRDLPYVMRAIEILNGRQELSCLYRQPLKRLLALSSVPPMLMRVSEAAERFADLKQYFSFFGYLLVSAKDRAVQDLVLQVLQELLQRKAPVGACCVRLSDSKKAVESSELPEILVQLLEVADEGLYPELLKLAALIVQISDQICYKMLQVSAIEHLLLRLNPTWQTRTFNVPIKLLTIAHLHPTCKIVWILLSSLKNANADFLVLLKPPGVESLRSLSYAIRIASTKNNPNCRSDRTDLMGILVQLLRYFPNMLVTQAGLTDDIVVLVGKSDGTWASEIVKLEPCELDYRFIIMLLFAVRYLVKIGNAAPRYIMQQRGTVAAVLKILHAESSAVPWNPHYRLKLISLSIYVLQYLVPILSSDFDHCNGSIELLSMLDFYNLEPYEVTTMISCQRTLEVIMVTHEDIKGLRRVLRQNGAVSIICELCNNLLSKDVLTPNSQTCLHHGFSTLSKLCNYYQEAGEGVYRLTKRFMDRVLNPSPEDPVFHPNMIISCLDLIWEGVVWNDANLEVFVKSGGVYDLLDIIQHSILPVKMMALSVLVDLCDEGSCIPHLITWRGNGLKLISMLLEIFRKDCRRLGVKLSSNYVIADIEIPIMGEQQWYETFGGQKHDPNSSPALTDLLLNCRPKIYAIVQLLNSRHTEQVTIANEHYCLYNDRLNAQDEITMLLVETYLPLKMGETWVELMRDIAKARIIPIACDNDLVKSMTLRYYKWGLHIRTLQEEVLALAKYNDESRERMLYHILREARLDKALSSLRELHYISKATTSMLRMAYKNKQRRDLEETLRFTDDDETYKHRTYMDRLDVTCLFNNAMTLNVQSNRIVEDQYLIRFCLDPVSSDTDDEFLEDYGENVSY